MSVFFDVFLAVFAVLGAVLAALELARNYRAKRTEFICVCFREELLEGGIPDMLIICRTDAEQEEIIRRICAGEDRKVFIKRW